MNKEQGVYFFEHTGEKNCNCLICQNGIRDEYQYAAIMLMRDRCFLVDAYEAMLLQEHMRDEESLHFPEVVADESKTPVLAYGVLMPSIDSDVTNWTEEMGKWKNVNMCTVENDKLFCGCYTDIELYEDKPMYNKYIPCALLLHMPYNLSQKRQMGFGHTTFIRYTYAETKEHMDILDNIINRPFLLCIAEKEKKFDGNTENWKQQIDEKKLMKIARRLF